MDSGAQSLSHRESGAGIFDCPGPLGEGHAGGRSDHLGTSHYLETEFLPWVNTTLAVPPANPDDAHRPLEKHHDLAAILSHVERRRVNHEYTFSLDAKIYRIARRDIYAGLRGASIRVEQRRDGSVCARFGDRYRSIET